MFDVKSLLLGLFITSCMLVFGLWINLQVNSSVLEIDFTPSKTEVLNAGEHVSSSSINRSDNTSVAIIDSPTTFANRVYTWDSPSEAEVPAMRGLVKRELGEYTDTFLANVGLKRIVLVDNIKNRVGSPVLGFSDPLRGEIYLNTVKLEGQFSREVVAEQTIHHEVAHLLAYNTYGYWFDRESGWQELGSADLYGKISNSNKEYFPEDGFVSRYGMTSPSEDFAEAYSLIFTEYFQNRLKAEVKGSELLSRKMKVIYETISQADPAQCLASFQAFERACD